VDHQLSGDLPYLDIAERDTFINPAQRECAAVDAHQVVRQKRPAAPVQEGARRRDAPS
jgi:hypothetical protein